MLEPGTTPKFLKRYKNSIQPGGPGFRRGNFRTQFIKILKES